MLATGRQMPAAYYNEKIPSEIVDGWPLMYSVVSGIISTVNWHKRRILDCGCGPGRMVEFLPTHNVYTGIDWSAKCIKIARKKWPNHDFRVVDFLKDDFEFENYDTFLFLEVLEHIEQDLRLLSHVPENSHVIISVPNRDDEAHVRYFVSLDEAMSRYSSLIDYEFAGASKVNNSGKMFFILYGVKRG